MGCELFTGKREQIIVISNTKKNSPTELFFDCLAASYSHRGKPPTTIGAEKLNFRVRYGNGCDLLAIAARLFGLRIVPSKLDNVCFRR